MRDRRGGLMVIAGLTAVVMAVGLAAQAGGSARKSGGRGIATRDGQKVSVDKLPVAQTFSVGNHALEPTLGLDPAGNIYYAAAGFDGPARLAATQIMRSKDQGKSWDVATPRTLGQDTMPITLDPYIFVDDNIDGDNARIFTIDLTLACSYLSFSDDGGETFVTNPLACGRPVNDHQTLFSGPPVSSPTVGYPNVLYYCFNDVGSSSCTKSLDGGLTFSPTGSPAYPGYEPGNEDPGFGLDGFCGGLHGHGAVAPDGTVYLPREFCGRPELAVSTDEGLTWKRVVVSKKIRSTSQPKSGTGHPSVAVDAKGNVYYLWTSDKNRLPYLSVSKNQGKTWSDPVVASIPGLTETNLPQIDARGVGKIAFVYYGSSNSPYPKCGLKCETKDYENTTWNGYLGVSADALSSNPTFVTGAVSERTDPLVRGRCGPGRCQSVFDFIDVEIGPDGIAYGAFVDDCMNLCAEGGPSDPQDYEGLMTKLVGAPSLR